MSLYSKAGDHLAWGHRRLVKSLVMPRQQQVGLKTQKIYSRLVFKLIILFGLKMMLEIATPSLA